MRATIVEIEPSREAALLRLCLESLGAEVRLVGLGRPSDFFTAFDFFGAAPDLAIVCGHGANGDLLMPPVAPGVDTLELPGNRLTPALAGARFRAAAPVVLSTACSTGTSAWFAAFRAGGCRCYVAPAGDPEGAAVPTLLHLAFHLVLRGGLPWHAAIEAAGMHFAAEDRFAVFEA